MQQAIITFWHRAIDRKNRVFIWASLLVLVLTLAEGLQPLDHLFRLSRSGLFLQDAKPKLAIVLVDNASINRFGEWPWERKDIANLVTAIDRAGAKRMAFEHVFVPNQDDAGTAALARAFDALPQRPIIAASYEIDRAGSERKLKWPDRQLSAHAQVAISSFPISYMGYLLTIEKSVLVDGHELPSMAAALAGQPKNRGLDDYVDYSIRPESIPQVSATDVLAGRANDQLKGRQVLISSSRNEVLLPRVGSARFVMGHAMSAATLMEGAQRHIGPMPALIIGFLSSWLIITKFPWRLQSGVYTEGTHHEEEQNSGSYEVEFLEVADRRTLGPALISHSSISKNWGCWRKASALFCRTKVRPDTDVRPLWGEKNGGTTGGVSLPESRSHRSKFCPSRPKGRLF